MFSPLILAIISTIIIGGIVLIILNLIFSSKSEDEERDEELNESNETNDCQFADNKTQQNLIVDDNDVVVGVENDQKSKPTSEELKRDELAENKEPDQSLPQTNNKNEDLMNFVEIIDSNELTDERPQTQEVINEVIFKEHIKTTEDEFNPELNDNLNAETSKEQEFENENDLTNEFWNLDETQNLMHLNKSRPKKQKSRPSVKIVFTDQQKSEDPISKSAAELVENLFENLGSDIEEYKSKSDSELSFKDEDFTEEKVITESEVCETIEDSFSKTDDTFEEIISGDYKKFDEFSDSFRSETRKHEYSRKVYEISSVKNYEITVNSSEQEFNEDMFDNLMKNFDPKDAKTEVFEENYNKVTESEIIEVRKGDKTQVIPIRNDENISHTKTFNERSLSSSSLSKMSLDDLNLNMRSSKSRLSETIDSVTKPLLSSPTLFRRSFIQSDEEYTDENEVKDNTSRIQLPIFGRSQSSLMEEMKKKEFRKSLRPFNDSESDNK